jgi:hypothetical protein
MVDRKWKPPAELVRVRSIREGDKVKTSSKGKEIGVTQVHRAEADKVVVEFSNSDVRTYHPEDQIILVSRTEDQNL